MNCGVGLLRSLDVERAVLCRPSQQTHAQQVDGGADNDGVQRNGVQRTGTYKHSPQSLGTRPSWTKRLCVYVCGIGVVNVNACCFPLKIQTCVGRVGVCASFLKHENGRTKSGRNGSRLFTSSSLM
jgi:hypothetical protein